MYSLRIYGLRVYDLNRLQIYNLGNSGRILARILVYRGVVIRSLRVGCILASKVSSKAA